MDYKVLWLDTLEKYSTIKEMYIRCEETDPELSTNLQPLNEFRAALDHIMKINTIIYNSEAQEAELENKVKDQFIKLNAHLDRAFFDICDMLSINYRNKIIDILQNYHYSVISTVFPQYYGEWKKKIEEISDRIAQYRFSKGIVRENTKQTFDSYKMDVEYLKNVYTEIRDNMDSLEEIHKTRMQEAITSDQNDRKSNRIGIIGIVVGVLGVIVGIVGFLL